MSFDGVQFVRITKRMAAAAGYLELGMADHALERLSGLDDLGPLESEVELLRGEALRCQHRYAEAATSFKNAAKKAPSPQDRTAWLALSMCYRQAGDTARAIQSLAQARGARLPKRKPKPSI